MKERHCNSPSVTSDNTPDDTHNRHRVRVNEGPLEEVNEEDSTGLSHDSESDCSGDEWLSETSHSGQQHDAWDKSTDDESPTTTVPPLNSGRSSAWSKRAAPCVDCFTQPIQQPFQQPIQQQPTHQPLPVASCHTPLSSLSLSIHNKKNKRHQQRHSHRHAASSSSLAPSATAVEAATEVGWLGRQWRRVVQWMLRHGLDPVNRLRLSRVVQINLSFLTAHEALVLSQVLDVLDRECRCRHRHTSRPEEDDDNNNDEIWRRAFANRNVSRILVQAIVARYDVWFHWPTAVRHNRLFDLLSQTLPIVGALVAFPATENFPTTRNHALASLGRRLLGPGHWFTRTVTGGRQGLVTVDPHHPAQNLAPEVNGYETAHRQQYGTHWGRVSTNRFRLAHRLPTDESIVRTFQSVPIATLTNNGVVHTLRQLVRHWSRTLGVDGEQQQQQHETDDCGNFAHQRQEQLDPFETLRIHVPAVLLTLSSLRGRNQWDARVLGPFMQRLTNLTGGGNDDDDEPYSVSTARTLVAELLQCRDMVHPVCGGIPSVMEPYTQWLQLIALALERIQTEASQLYTLVSSVELGIRLGYDIMTQLSWTVPSNTQLMQSIRCYIRDSDESRCRVTNPTDRLIANALERTTPRDKRTLIELVRQNLSHTRPAQLLLARVKTLLQREIRRDGLNQALLELSQGGAYVASPSLLRVDDWYWLQEKDSRRRRCELVIYGGVDTTTKGTTHQFRRVTSGTLQRVSDASLVQRRWRPRTYVPIAESICRAQKVLMTIELEFGQRFSLNAFMEFGLLRVALRRLVVVGQMACSVLDNARLHILGDIQRTGGSAWCEGGGDATNPVQPQNITVIGGGPAGMMACLHCTENCLTSGGVMKLFEARDSFAKGGSTYERAQIVRLDARWIAAMRYHLGTGFEDVWIPASGETDAQLGNILPTQGFLEITIKDLENVLHIEISRFWSKGLITVFTDSRSQYDPSTNSLTKLGENLKVGDIMLRHLDSEGLPCPVAHPWKVIELVYTRLLEIDDLKVGEEYGVYYRPEQLVLPFRLSGVDLDTKIYHFVSELTGVDNLLVRVHDLPSVYPLGTSMKAHADVNRVALECIEKNHKNVHTRVDLLMDDVKKEKFTLHIGDTHVIEAIGKSARASPVHFKVTTPEPHGVCCLEGLKVSLGMHNFGETRWGSGIVDDIRSLTDRNTRIIGDFTKMVRTAPIVKLMHNLISSDNSWALHFTNLVSSSGFHEMDPVLPKLQIACEWLSQNASRFRRSTLQTRFFEVGDNFYLGMELPREYNQWKLNLADQLVIALGRTQNEVCQVKRELAHSIDRLWYFSCLETIRTGDVYNPGARRRIPQLYLIDKTVPARIGSLPVGESCRLAGSDHEKYEVLAVTQCSVVVRNVEGYVTMIKKSTMVTRESNLTRCPNGNEESKVALATFPVVHEVNHRTMRLSDESKGFVFAFIGDEQASPHFMRYSGLTGGMVNAASFNKFIEAALHGVPLKDRFRKYSKETNWSNGEVVQRGTGGNYGEDGFLRPGFSYSDCVDYLYSKLRESTESGQDKSDLLSRDWKAKISASLVPRGLEVNIKFIRALRFQWRKAVMLKVLREMESDGWACDDDIYRAMILAYTEKEQTIWCTSDQAMQIELTEKGQTIRCINKYWDEFVHSLPMGASTNKTLIQNYFSIVKNLSLFLEQVIDLAAEARLFNRRVTSELFNQPKPVDSIVDDFAVEAQTFASALTFAAAFGAAILALRLVERPIAGVAAAILGSLSIAISFGTMTNVSRYKIRNEEARVFFSDVQLPTIKRAVFAMTSKRHQQTVLTTANPLYACIDEACRQFEKEAIYYDCSVSLEFNAAFAHLQGNILDVANLREFQDVLIHLIADTYHVNSYVQESLVKVYASTEEAIFWLRRPRRTKKLSLEAEDLFNQLALFENRLEASLQRGPVLYGFLKSRRFFHWDILVVVRYMFSLVWWCRPRFSRFAPIEIEIWSILNQFRLLAEINGGQILARNVRDVETLYWATRESAVASMIFVSACLAFLSSIVFTLAWLFSIQAVAKLAFFAGAVSTFGAVLAISHLVRKLFLLARLIAILQTKASLSGFRRDPGWFLVRNVTVIQLLLTMARLVTASAATAALALACIENGYGNKINTPSLLPFWLGMVAFFSSIGSSLFFFVVDFVVRYNLPTELGPFICKIFSNEIVALRRKFNEGAKSSTTYEHAVDVEAWEYTARAFLHQYRFDTVFAADRFGQILQFIQSGKMESV